MKSVDDFYLPLIFRHKILQIYSLEKKKNSILQSNFTEQIVL